jgi:hypothetical protein
MIKQLLKLYCARRVITGGSIAYMFESIKDWSPLLDKLRKEFLKNPNTYLKEISEFLSNVPDKSFIDLNDCPKEDYLEHNKIFVLHVTEYRNMLYSLQTVMQKMAK